MRRLAAVAFVAFGLTADGAQARDLVVNRTDDAASDGQCTTAPGGCSLRDAFAVATSADRIVISAGTYNLVNNSLPLNGRTVVGAGARSTIIDAQAFSKVFYATGGSNSVSGLTMRNGKGDSEVGLDLPRGGAIFLEQGSLTLTGVTITGNTANTAGQIGRAHV